MSTNGFSDNGTGTVRKDQHRRNTKKMKTKRRRKVTVERKSDRATESAPGAVLVARGCERTKGEVDMFARSGETEPEECTNPDERLHTHG
jgi:hypothetical protein